MSDNGYIPPEQRDDPPLVSGKTVGCLLVLVLVGGLIYGAVQKSGELHLAQQVQMAISASGPMSGLQEKAEKGDDGAALALGMIYSTGAGVPKDEEEAYYWETIGPSYSHLLRPNLANNQKAKVGKRILDWRVKESADGNPHAQAQMGEAYMEGDGVEKDPAKGLEWLHKAIAQGDGGAMNSLGDAYASGTGVTQDWQEAYFWYEAEVKYVHGPSANRIYEVQNHLTPEQRAAAEKRAAEWKPGAAEK